MIPWNKLASTRAPDGSELSLWRRGDEIVVRVGSADLMSNRMHNSEEELAALGCEGLGSGACVLIGGLGLGFTLRAALGALPRQARVVVAELVPAMVDWLRGPVGAGALLDDPRVAVDLRDAVEVVRTSEARFDAVLLDLDNGPRALTHRSNRRLYGDDGLSMIARALRPGGRLAVWSAGGDAAFVGRMARAGFAARAIEARARPGRGARHAIFVGDRPRRPPGTAGVPRRS